MENKKILIFPACHIIMPSTSNRRAAFFLAAEEYVASSLPQDNYFFSWILNPTVVLGRNQRINQEVNLDFCQTEKIDVIRRRSGGGCIFADNGNIMFSLITGTGAVEPIFAAYAQNVAHSLQCLGADVYVSGRNDIILNGHGKICGNAFYHSANRNIVHGTMLYDTNTRLMKGALRPDLEKLKSAGVKSVRKRIGLLKDTLSCHIEDLRTHLIHSLTNRSITLTEKDVKKIETIESEYYKKEFLYGRHNSSLLICSDRIEGCGKIEIRFDLSGNMINAVELSGDFFEWNDSLTVFQETFSGIEFSPASIKEAIRNNCPEKSIRGLSQESLIALLTPDKLESTNYQPYTN